MATALAFFGYNYILFFFLTWFPSYLTEAQHLSIKDMSLANVLPWFLGFVGLALSGILSDAIFRRTGKALEARKLVLTVCLGVAGLCVILAGLVHTAWSALALMSCAIFFFTFRAALIGPFFKIQCRVTKWAASVASFI